MSIEITNMALKKILRINVFDIGSNALKVRIHAPQQINFQNTADSVPIESQGVEIARFDTGKTFSLTGSSALVTEGLLQLQTGSPIKTVKNTKEIRYTDVLTVNNNKAMTSFVAKGVPGREIEFVYPHRQKNGYINTTDTIKQDLAIGVGKFTYDIKTKEITFNEDEFPDGSEIVVFYYPEVTEAKMIISRNDTFSESGCIEIDIAIEDTCTHEQYLGKFIIPSGKFSGSFELAVDGTNPSVHNFEVNAQHGCSGEGELWKWFVYKSEDIS